MKFWGGYHKTHFLARVLRFWDGIKAEGGLIERWQEHAMVALQQGNGK